MRKKRENRDPKKLQRELMEEENSANYILRNLTASR